MKVKGFYFITDRALSKRGICRDTKDALRAGVKFIQYRNKSADTQTLLKEALKLRALCNGVKLIINDRLDIALASGADGVHLGQYDISPVIARGLLGRKKTIGVTVHNLSQARQAQKLGADYLGVSPIFVTATKQDAGRPVGVKLIREIKRCVSLPIVAIGGIDLLNAPKVIEAGADALSAISAVLCGKNPRKEIEKFQRLFGNQIPPSMAERVGSFTEVF